MKIADFRKEILPLLPEGYKPYRVQNFLYTQPGFDIMLTVYKGKHHKNKGVMCAINYYIIEGKKSRFACSPIMFSGSELEVSATIYENRPLFTAKNVDEVVEYLKTKPENSFFGVKFH